jgi:DNA-binding PadR family transcriptional regulator
VPTCSNEIHIHLLAYLRWRAQSHGYGMKGWLKANLGIAIHHQRIYDSLGDLVRQGLLRVVPEPIPARSGRTYYAITDAGALALDKLMAEEAERSARITKSLKFWTENKREHEAG